MKVKLSDVCSSIYDGDHNAPPKAAAGVPFVTISNFDPNDGEIDFSDTSFVPVEYYESLKPERRPRKDDVLYSVVGSFGIPSLVKDNSEFVFQRHVAILRPNELIDPRYLYYVMKNRDFYHWADSVAIGAAQRTVTLGQLRTKEIELPEREVQVRIADVLSAYDELIENNRRQIKLLEEAAQRLYKEWFIDLKFPGHETTPIHNGLPEGWEWKHLHEFADVVMGQSPKSEYYNDEHEGLPFHQGVGSYGKRYVIDGTFCTQPTRIAKAGSVLFSVRAPVGRLNITKNEIIIGRGLAGVNHHDGKQSFLFYLLKERFFEDDLLGNGAIFSSITKQELLALSFLIPDSVTIDRFEKITSTIDEKIKELDNQGNLLAEARDRLLPKLMSGEIEV
ncbi:restriction endonuclease subunit S [Raoultibacter massiliensis]|uniref:restriction endonuclease subunit S n=1 Tax=Raoultibacter massiliensis TaxID=1852371 RepID=UPI000C81EDA6|nr:restriction endonuclease subunit S [Raoultibacter massiliensis]